MKTDVHPEYFTDATVKCGCGQTYTIGSTVKEQSVEVCANCHPFYTGQEKEMDTAGRIEKFRARMKKAKK